MSAVLHLDRGDMVCDVRVRFGPGAHVRNRHKRISAYRCLPCNRVVVDRPTMGGIGARRSMLTKARTFTTVTPAALTGSGNYLLPSNYVASTLAAEIIAPGGGARGGVSGLRIGGGGGGGAYSAGIDTTCTASQNVAYDTGTPGSGSPFNSSTGLTSATNAFWNTTGTIMAEGGQAAGAATTALGGAGGQASNSVGTTKVNGSNGSNGTITVGSGNGGAAASGGTLVGGAGGAGADGATPGYNGNNQSGKAGIFPGGGGGGGRQLTNGNGAPGAAGTIKISYTVVT